MRILCLTPWFPARPGAQSGNFILDSLLALKEQGHCLRTLVCQPWHPRWAGLLHEDWGRERLQPAQHDPQLQVGLLHYPSIPRNHCRAVAVWMCRQALERPLLSCMAEFRPDLLLVHTEQLGMVASHAAAHAGIPWLLVVHGVNTSPRLNTAAERARMGAALRAASRVVVVGEPLLEPVARLAGRSDHVRVVHNGVRLPPPGTPQPPGLSQRPLRFISVSNLAEGKGIDINLQALARLDAAGFADWHYTIVGGGSQAGELQRLAQALGIAGKVQFTGAVAHDRVYSLLVQASVFLLPSWQEAFGVAWLEGMACGLLAIAARGQGPAAFIRHDDTGLLVAPRSVEAVADCLQRVMTEPELLQQVALRGQAHVRRSFTWAEHARRLAEVCSEMVTTA